MSDATALARTIAAGRTTARAAMEAAIGAARERAALGAITRLEPELALAAADKADAAPQDARGPLHGVPFLAKDLGSAAAGMAPGAGSPALRARQSDPETDSALFARFRAAGLIPFGLTTVAEFGLSLTSEPPGAAPARNPWNQALSPGGSSGGAAAAVAAGIVAIAHATDAAGSIRVPAACTGLVGLKPSRGAMPGGPEFNNHLMGIAAELVLARSVRDVTTAFDVTSGNARGPFAEAAERMLPSQMRIGMAIPDGCATPLTKAVIAAADALADTGCHIHTIKSPDALGTRSQAVVRAVLTASMADWFDTMDITDDEVTPISAAAAAEGRAMGAPALFAASREIASISHRAWALFDGYDLLLSPVLSDAAPAIGAFDAQATDVGARFDQMAAIAPNASLANIAGLPALALPFGTADGMPVGLQLIGPMGADRAVLALGARLEALAPTLEFPFALAGMVS